MRQEAKHRNGFRPLVSAGVLLMLFSLLGALPQSALAQSNAIQRDYNDGRNDIARYDHDLSIHYADFIEFDPTLDVEIWTDNESGVYHQGDEIKIYFQASHDSYVAIYNVDTDGRVNLIYPFDANDDPFIEGGQIYRIPDQRDDFDLVLRGPAGSENIQIIASRTPLPIPDWYEGSDLISSGDRYEFIDYINGKYFGCRSGCPRAYDQVSYTVREWDSYYYRPVYYDPWPHWRHYGGIYVDYYWGCTIYVDGFYYGIAPLYLPRISLGHHIVTIFDSHGHVWEDRVHIRHNHRLRLDNTIIRTGAGVRSRYRSVNRSGYRDPVANGYRDVRITSKYKPRVSAPRKALKAHKQSLDRAQRKAAPVRGFDYKKSTTKNDKLSVRKQKARSSNEMDRGGSRLAPHKAGKARREAVKKEDRARSRTFSKRGHSSDGSARISGPERTKRSGSRSARVERQKNRTKSGNSVRRSEGSSSKRQKSSASVKSSKNSSKSSSSKSSSAKSGSSSRGKSGASSKGSSGSKSGKSGKTARSGKSGKSGKKR